VRWQNRDPEAMKVNKISKEMLAGAPNLKNALEAFSKAFPKNVIFAYYGGPLDADMLRASYKRTKMVFPFDYHFFNIWAVFYAYFAVRRKLKNKKRFTGFTLEDAMKHFKIKAKGRHDALVDVLVEADILRKIIEELK
jgi:DNA polymerase III epsilon subunit-like protein